VLILLPANRLPK